MSDNAAKKRANLPFSLRVPGDFFFDMNAEDQLNRHQCRSLWVLAARMLTMNKNRLSKLEHHFLKVLAASIPHPNLASDEDTRKLLKCFIDPEDKATLYKCLVLGYAISGKRDRDRLDLLAEVRRNMDYPLICYNQICLGVSQHLDRLDLSVKGLHRDSQLKILALASKMVYADESAAKSEVITFRSIINELEEEAGIADRIGELAGVDVLQQMESLQQHEMIIAFASAVRVAVADRKMDARELRILNELTRLLKLDDWQMHLIFLYLDLLSNASLSPTQGKPMQRVELPAWFRSKT